MSLPFCYIKGERTVTITSHAIKRYKKRIGNKTTSKTKVIARINSGLKNDVISKKPIGNGRGYMITTSKFRAICHKQTVLTILPLHEDRTEDCAYKDFVTA